MISLKSHLAAVPLEEEVSEFSEGDGSTVVDIDSEHVLHDVVDFILGLLMENLNDDLFDAFNIDLSVVVLVLLELSAEFGPNVSLESFSCTLHELMLLKKDMYMPTVEISTHIPCVVKSKKLTFRHRSHYFLSEFVAKIKRKQFDRFT